MIPEKARMERAENGPWRRCITAPRTREKQMTNPVIPAAAVDAALDAMRPLPPVKDRSRRRMVEVILKAAAPHMLAPAPAASERAMTDIAALLEQHYAGNIYSPDVINGVSRIVGRYDMERIGEGA